MRILGIDPGTRITGYGVIETNGQNIEPVAYGCIQLAKLDFPNKVAHLISELRDLIEQYQPSVAAIEEVFVHKNPQSALKLGQARGIIFSALSLSGLVWAGYTPREVKQAVVGYGAAQKDQVQHMIQALLKLPSQPASDAADGLAIAICHAHTATYGSRVQSSAKKGRSRFNLKQVEHLIANPTKDSQ